jgi:hydrogenase nickel incorporation protein HypA/HybF
VHELSIAAAVVRSVTDALPGRRVTCVRLRVGALSGVVAGALGFAWDVAADGLLAGSRLEVETAPVRTACRTCGREADLPDPLPVRCPHCAGRDVDVLGGREIELVSVDVDDEVGAA